MRWRVAGTVIIGATECELSTVVENMTGRRKEFFFPAVPAFRGSVGKKQVHVIRSGPGIANAAAATAVAVQKYKPEHIYNVGVCGVYADNADLLACVVTGVEALFADAGVELRSGYQSLQAIDLPLACLDDGSTVYNRVRLADPGEAGLQQAVFLTVSASSGCARRAKALASRYRVKKGRLLCEDMESAAVGLIALKAAVPCTVIRGISNLCGSREHGSWRLTDAARAAQHVLLSIL